MKDGAAAMTQIAGVTVHMERAYISWADRDCCSRIVWHQEMGGRTVVEQFGMRARTEPEVEVAFVKRVAEGFLGCVLEGPLCR